MASSRWTGRARRCCILAGLAASLTLAPGGCQFKSAPTTRPAWKPAYQGPLQRMPRLEVVSPGQDHTLPRDRKELELTLDLGARLAEDARLIVLFTMDESLAGEPVLELAQRPGLCFLLIQSDHRQGEGPRVTLKLGEQSLWSLRHLNRGQSAYSGGRRIFWRALMMAPGAGFAPEAGAIHPERPIEIRDLSKNREGVLELQSMDQPARLRVPVGAGEWLLDVVAIPIANAWWIVMFGLLTILSLVETFRGREREATLTTTVEAGLGIYPMFCLCFWTAWAQNQDAFVGGLASSVMGDAAASVTSGNLFTDTVLAAKPVFQSTSSVWGAIAGWLVTLLAVEGAVAAIRKNPKGLLTGVGLNVGILAGGVAVLAVVWWVVGTINFCLLTFALQAVILVLNIVYILGMMILATIAAFLMAMTVFWPMAIVLGDIPLGEFPLWLWPLLLIGLAGDAWLGYLAAGWFRRRMRRGS